MLPDLSWLVIPNYDLFTWEDWLAYFLCGLAGFFIWTVHTHQPLTRPYRCDANGWQLGSLPQVLVCITFASLADHNLAIATIAAAGSQVLVDVVMCSLPAAVRRFLNLPDK